MYVVFAICIICTICALVSLPMDIQENVDGMFALVVCCGLMWVMIQGVKFIHLYYSREMTMYYDDYILVRNYKYEDKIVTYEEIGKTIREKRIRVRKGRLELPFVFSFSLLTVISRQIRAVDMIPIKVRDLHAYAI